MADEESGGLPSRPGRKRQFDCCLGFGRLVNVTTGLSAMLCLVAHAMKLHEGPDFNTDLAAFTEQSLRLYGILFSLVIVLVETEWQFVLKKLQLLEGFVSRALLQLFLSILTLHSTTVDIKESESGDDGDDFRKSIKLYGRVSGFTLLGCSALYFLGGIICCGVLKRARQKRLNARSRVEMDLQATQKREKELRGLLANYSGE